MNEASKSERSEPEVAILGLGPMGFALARAMLASGHSVTVWNRTGSRADPLEARGGVVARSLEAAIRSAPVVLICLATYDIALRLFKQIDTEALRGRTLVQLTTGTPEDARRFEVWAEGKGADYLDGVINSWPHEIGSEDALISYSGNLDLFRSLEPMLSALGGTPEYEGRKIDSVAVHDLVGQAGYYVCVCGLLQSIALGTRLGLSATQALDAVRSMLPLLDVSATQSASLVEIAAYGNRPGPDRATLDAQARMMEVIRRALAEAGIATDLMDALTTIAERGRQAGYEAADLASLVEVFWAGGG